MKLFTEPHVNQTKDAVLMVGIVALASICAMVITEFTLTDAQKEARRKMEWFREKLRYSIPRIIETQSRRQTIWIDREHPLTDWELELIWNERYWGRNDKN